MTEEEFRRILAEELKIIIKGMLPQLSVQDSSNEEELWSRRQVIEHFGITFTTLHKWIKRSILPVPFKVGRRTYFRKVDILKIQLQQLEK
ncbi:MAG: hypothetical protein SH856_04720 [Flavobacteriales bacterium]|nr:hypothetical protein [Flavobacteriales bacterium]